MAISREEIKHLANLSNLSLSSQELDSLQHDMDNIINFVDQLNELDIEDVEPTYQVFETTNAWRPETIESFEADREALLTLAPDSYQHQIKVPKVL